VAFAKTVDEEKEEAAVFIAELGCAFASPLRMGIKAPEDNRSGVDCVIADPSGMDRSLRMTAVPPLVNESVNELVSALVDEPETAAVGLVI
jgi:hypothetical protein